jgi:hypothetical protein
MAACPSRLELSRWEAHPEGERPAEIVVHVESCDRCGAVLADISAARSLLLGANPEAASLRAARAILEQTRARRSPRRWLKLLVPVLLVPAAAALLLVARPVLHDRAGVKGSLIIETYCKRGEAVFLAVDGAEFLSGDRLRFAYTVAKPGFLLVFGMDDRGVLFPYYQEQSLLGVPVEAGSRVLLPGSVELDGHRGWERIFAMWSEGALREDLVRRAAASALGAASGDLQRTTTLDLPVEQVSFLLRKP